MRPIFDEHIDSDPLILFRNGVAGSCVNYLFLIN